MDFGNRLKELLEQREISQKEFAAMLNIAPTTLNGYIKNRRQPDIDTIKKIAYTLNVSTDFLLDHNGNGTFSAEELSFIFKIRNMDKQQRDIIYDLTNIIDKKYRKKG